MTLYRSYLTYIPVIVNFVNISVRSKLWPCKLHSLDFHICATNSLDNYLLGQELAKKIVLYMNGHQKLYTLVGMNRNTRVDLLPTTLYASRVAALIFDMYGTLREGLN